MIDFPSAPTDGHVVTAWSVVHERIVAYRWVYHASSACADVPGAPAHGRPLRDEWAHYEDGRMTGRSDHALLAPWVNLNQQNLYATEREAIIALLDLLRVLIEDSRKVIDQMGARAVRCRARLRQLPETDS